MIGATSPATTQIRNNTALDGTRSSSPAARNPAESRADAPLPQTAPSDDSVNNGSGSLSEQPSSTSRLSGSENEQPGNPAATLTASQAQAIIADSLDKVATGEIAPFEPEGFSTIDTTDAAAAADTIGRLLARDGASADLSKPLSIIAAARANEVNLGTNDEDLASFDNALETLVIQRFLSATGNPDADPALLSESRDILLTSSFIPASDDDAFDIATQAILAVTVGIVAPDETIDLSGASAQELGSAAADAADRLGRLAGAFRFNDAYSEAQIELSTIRAQLVDNGASFVQLNAFDTAVATIATERSFEAVGSPLFDANALQEARTMLKSGELEALSNPNSEFEVKLASTAGQLVRSAIDDPIDTALASDVATLSSDDILARLSNAANRMAEEASDSLPFSLDENIDRLENTAAKEYAAIRAQLKADGATEEQLVDLDDVVTQVAIQNAKAFSPDLKIDGLRVSRTTELRLAIITENLRPAALSRTELVRNARQDSDSVLTESELRPIQEALAIALQHEASAEFSSGNLLLANFGELSGLLSEAADTIAQALATNDDAKFQRGLELFDQVRDEIVRRTPVNTLPNAFINAFEQRIADAQNALQAPGPEADARIANSNAAILSALSDLVVDGPFGIASQNSFEGNNGAESANIFVIELKPGRAANDPDQFAGHDVVVTNVIETQLQEAEQSYELTTIQTEPGQLFSKAAREELGSQGDATAAALLSVANMAKNLEGPTYVNLSLAQLITPQEIGLAFTLLFDTGLVPDEVASTPPTQENFDVFADTVRSIALASLDPERTDVAQALRPELTNTWQRIGAVIQALEAAAEAGVDVFISIPNSAGDFSAYQFAQDDGLAGSITRVAATSASSVFDSNDFVLPEQGEDFPENEAAPNGIAVGDPIASFYRGTGVDAYAPGVTEGGVNESRIFGASFAAPEMLVNAVLGRFDPGTEMRIGG